MLPEIATLDEMAESSWQALARNLGGITDAELDWAPHATANTIRWIVGHLGWYEEWAHDAIEGGGRYLSDGGPASYVDQTFAVVWSRYEAARLRYRARLARLTSSDLDRVVNYFGRGDLTVREHVREHVLHLSGHRFQVRYIRGAYSRATGTRKAAFDPW